MILLIMLSTSAHSAEYFLEPAVNIRTFADDNVRLSTDESDVVGGAVTEGSMNIGVRNPRTRLNLKPSLKISRLTQDVGLDTEDVKLDINAIHLPAERLQLTFDANLAEESIGAREVNVTGLTFDEVSKETTVVSPAVTYFLDDRNSVRFAYNYRDVFFEDAQRLGLTNFTFQQASIIYQRSLTERSSLDLQYSHSVFEVPDAGSQTDSNSIRAGFTHAWNETLTLSAGAGMIFSDSEFDISTPFGVLPGEESVSGSLFDLSLDRNFETMNISAGLTRSVSPGARGDLDVRDTWTMNLDRQFSDRWRGDLDLEYLENRSQNEFSAFNNDFDLLRVTAGMSWSFTRQLSLAGGVTYRRLTNAGVSESPESTQLFFTLNYDFDRISISR